MRTLKTLTVVFLLCMLILPCKLAHTETLEEIKARVRNEVRSQYGKTPASPRDPGEAVKTSKKPQTAKKSGDLSMLLDVEPDTALRFAFVIMLFAVIPAAIARAKGRSFIAWWVLGTLFFIIVMPVSIFLKKKKPLSVSERPGAGPQEKEAGPEESPLRVKTQAATAEDLSFTRDSKDSAAIEVYEKIERLAALKEKGILTEDEFKAKKNELLSRI